MSDQHTWIPVAFVRQTGGRLHVLFALDRDGVAAFDGEPVLLVDHRPGDDTAGMAFEPAEVVAPEVIAALDAHRAQFAACFDAAYARDGSFDAERLVAQRVHIVLQT